jgi:protein involved in temperature-dependent protein secretion
MTYADLRTHLYRLEDVRSEVVDQGDVPSPELEDRLRSVRALIAAVKRRQEERAHARTASVPSDTHEIDLQVRA